MRPNARVLAPIMPWRAFANLTPSDAVSIANYLKSLPAVSHRVPGPFGSNETATTFVMKVVPRLEPLDPQCRFWRRTADFSTLNALSSDGAHIGAESAMLSSASLAGARALVEIVETKPQ